MFTNEVTNSQKTHICAALLPDVTRQARIISYSSHMSQINCVV